MAQKLTKAAQTPMPQDTPNRTVTTGYTQDNDTSAATTEHGNFNATRPGNGVRKSGGVTKKAPGTR